MMAYQVYVLLLALSACAVLYGRLVYVWVKFK